MSAGTRLPPHKAVKIAPKIGGETLEDCPASTATGARRRSVATRLVWGVSLSVG